MKKLKFLIIFLFTIFQYYFRLTPFQLYKKKKEISVINYHYFLENNEVSNDESLEINISTLEKQLQILFKNNKFLNTIDDLSLFFKNNHTTGGNKRFLITIDDADCNIKKILPIFNKYRIPFILFIPFGFCLDENSEIGLKSRCLHHLYFKILKDNSEINLEKILLDNFSYIMNLDKESLKTKYKDLIKNNESFFVKKNFLSFSDLKEFSKKNFITLGSHSMSHVPMNNLPNKWLFWEISESKKLIKEINGDQSIFSYPYGYANSYNQNVKNALNYHNIKYAFTTRSYLININTDPLELGRSYFFNNCYKNYILGTAYGSMQRFDTFLRR